MRGLLCFCVLTVLLTVSVSASPFSFPQFGAHLPSQLPFGISANVDPRIAPNFSPVPVWGRQSYWGTGNTYAGFTPPGLLSSYYFNNDPATIAVSIEDHVIFINETNSWIWFGPEFSCISSPGYEVYSLRYADDSSKPWTYFDEVNGYTQVVEMSKTLGNPLYTTVSPTSVTLPLAKGTTVVIDILPFLPYSQYQTVIVVDNANSANFFQGTVISYVGRKLTLQVLLSVGSGTIGLWDVYVSGDQTYTGPSYDGTGCNTTLANTFTTDAAGYLKVWAGWELYDILEQPGEVDISVSVLYIDTIYPGQPPASLLTPPPGCNAANTNDYCVANRELPGEFPQFLTYPGPAFVSPFLPN